ncbi:MAG: DUF5050 domain-containing protein [bacterium]|nr:DUF5050 domain-containing protein [bacterium]MDY4100107.1 DUF5050 domain-containing protein [Lachnospiraceae bacterium]
MMKKIIRYLTCIVLTMGMALGTLVLAPDTAQAASAYVYEYSDMIGQGGYIYYIRSSASGPSASIWRMKVETGETSKVVSAPRGIVKLIVSRQQLYYVTSNDKGQWEVRSCPLNGGASETVCEGFACYADTASVYVIRYLDDKAYLYRRDLESGEETLIKATKKDQTLDYVCNIGSQSYYYLYDVASDKLYIFCLNTTAANQKLIRIAAEKRVVKGSTGRLLVSDIKQIDQELYYAFGSYEGSGSFWNGTIKKLTVDGAKKTVAKLVEDKQIIAGKRQLYYQDMKGNAYKYDLKTGKKAKYSLKFENNISYTVLGDKTYLVDTSNKKKIVLSRFNSGTDREVLTSFLTIPFKQKANISYSVSIKQVGIYYAICVTGRDFTDMSYGWRGKLVSMNWYIADSNGKALRSFQ